MSTNTFPFGQDIAWQPNPDWIAQSNLQRFMDRHGIPSYDALLTRSVEDIGWFWDAVMEDLDIRFTHPYSQIVDLSAGAPFARWCVDGQMNIIHNCLDKWQTTETASELALIWEGRRAEPSPLPTPNFTTKSVAAPMPCAALASEAAMPSDYTCRWSPNWQSLFWRWSR